MSGDRPKRTNTDTSHRSVEPGVSAIDEDEAMDAMWIDPAELEAQGISVTYIDAPSGQAARAGEAGKPSPTLRWQLMHPGSGLDCTFRVWTRGADEGEEPSP